MSVIAVDGFTHKVNLTQVVKTVAKAIGGHFEALNFFTHPDRAPFKTCYLRLSERLDPCAVVERINNMLNAKNLYAHIPKSVPNMQVAQKPKIMPLKMRKRMRIHGECNPEHVLLVAHKQIMEEMQHKYVGLHALSSKTSHKLLENLGVVIADRLKKLILSGDPNDQSFKLTGRYRKAHPHFGDFQLILSTLHRLQDASGTPRTQLKEAELTAVPKDFSVVDNVPFTKAKEVCGKYTNKIVQKLQNYVNEYDLTRKPDDTEEDKARKTIQKHLANMMPYLPTMMKQLVTNHFTPNTKGGMTKMRAYGALTNGQLHFFTLPPDQNTTSTEKIRQETQRMYGEPYLPPKEASLPFLRTHRAARAQRCQKMFNLLLFHVTRDRYAKLIAADGTRIGSTKLIIRPSHNSSYNMPHATMAKFTSEVAKATL